METSPVVVASLPVQAPDAAAAAAAPDAGGEASFGNALQTALTGQQVRGQVATLKAEAEGNLLPADATTQDDGAAAGQALPDVGALVAMMSQLAMGVTVPVPAQAAAQVAQAEVAPEGDVGQLAPAAASASRALRPEALQVARTASAERSASTELPVAADGKGLPVGAAEIADVADFRSLRAVAPEAELVRAEPQTDRPSVTHVATPDNGSAQLSVIGAPHRPAADAPARVEVTQPVGSHGWDAGLGEKVVWMATQKHQVAELQLNPPNLGPLEVRLTVNNDQASALFVSHSAPVREAIEAALPRLRDMLADSGIQLGNVSVGAESFARQQSQGDSGNNGGDGRRYGSAENGRDPVFSSGEIRVRVSGNGLVDLFA